MEAYLEDKEWSSRPLLEQLSKLGDIKHHAAETKYIDPLTSYDLNILCIYCWVDQN